jgi:SAM-dependent methyltransferase
MPGPGSDHGYLTDVTYVRQFCSELNPNLWRAAAALAGCPAPAGDDFDYCELGSGLGDTLATFAAAYPRARFVGVDVNPEHIGAARGLASRSALSNVRFLERDFEDLRADELPPLDYVCAHGLLTWIPPEKRRALFARAAAWLKPGGLLYLGYNALPGWAAVEPLRRLMLDASVGVEGGSEARVRHALAFAKILCDGHAGYFVSNPSAKEILATMLKMGVPYTAHEFFHAHWHPMYFADVVREAAEHDLRFVGQIPLHLNYRDLTIPPPLQESLRSVSDRRAWEHLKDFATNESFRRDVYVKGAVGRAEDTSRTYLESTPFGTLVPADQVKRDVPLASRSLHFSGPLFDAVIARIARRSSTVRELAREPSLATFDFDAIRQAVLHLILGADVLPVALGSTECIAIGSRYRVASAFNRAILTQPLSNRAAVVLASPVAGTGVGLSMIQAVMLRALTEARSDERTAWIRSLVDRSPLRAWDHGSPLDSKEDVARVIGQRLESFCTTWLPKLVELGVVEPEP